jgi:hypothetical protein
MKKILPWTFLALVVLTACINVTKHRMRAANRKLMDAEAALGRGEWEQAGTLAAGMRESVAKSVADQPARATASGATVDLRPLLAAWEAGAWKELDSAVQARDDARARRAFQSMRQQCAGCHLALGRTDIKILE